jgi:hypothetical protein
MNSWRELSWARNNHGLIALGHHRGGSPERAFVAWIEHSREQLRTTFPQAKDMKIGDRRAESSSYRRDLIANDSLWANGALLKALLLGCRGRMCDDRASG